MADARRRRGRAHRVLPSAPSPVLAEILSLMELATLAQATEPHEPTQAIGLTRTGEPGGRTIDAELQTPRRDDEDPAHWSTVCLTPSCCEPSRGR